jgi:hypothetical protein
MLDAMAHSFNDHVEHFLPKLPEVNDAIKETVTQELQSRHTPLKQGYALKIQATPVKVSPAVKVLLTEMFENGIIHKRKMTPVEAVKQIRNKRHPNGKRVYSRREHLRTEHVARFWSKLKSVREHAPTVPGEAAVQLQPVQPNDNNAGDDANIVEIDEHVVHVSLSLQCLIEEQCHQI